VNTEPQSLWACDSGAKERQGPATAFNARSSLWDLYLEDFSSGAGFWQISRRNRDHVLQPSDGCNRWPCWTCQCKTKDMLGLRRQELKS